MIQKIINKKLEFIIMNAQSIILHCFGIGSMSLLSLHTYQISVHTYVYVGDSINKFLENLIVSFIVGSMVNY